MIYLTYRIVGWVILVGMVIILLLAPYQVWQARKFSKFREQTAGKTDVRIRLMNEIVTGIRVIKMYAWEKPFSKLITDSRRSETEVIFKSLMFRAINIVIYFATSNTVVVVMLLPIVLMEKQVTPEMVFLPLAWINVVRLSIALFVPNAIASLSETKISVERIQKFLEQDELKKDTMTDEKPQEKIDSTPQLVFDHLICSWSSKGKSSIFMKSYMVIANCLQFKV